MIKLRPVICVKLACLSLASACSDPIKVRKPDSKQPPVKKSDAAASSNGNSTKDTGTASHLLYPPAGYELIAKCDKIFNTIQEPDTSETPMSSSAVAARDLMKKLVSMGKVSFCKESFAPQGISDAVRANIIEEALFNCESPNASSKLSIKSPEPCAPPVFGEQTIDSTPIGQNGTVTAKLRSTFNVGNLSNQEKDVLKKGWFESTSDSSTEQRRVTPDLE